MLSPEALKERKRGIGASDAAKIVAGEWHQLWLEKTSRSEGEDLTWVFPVQLGSVTEELNLLFYAHATGHTVARKGDAVMSMDHPFLRCTLDGWDVEEKAVIECKHVNGFSKIEVLRQKYFPQVQHQMLCTGAQKSVLSAIIGTSEPVREPIERDDFWLAEYVESARTFWGFVERDEEPTQGKPMGVTAVIPVDKMRVVDMRGRNAWGNAAADWLNSVQHAKLFKSAETDIKSMIEPDVREASGFGIKVSRNSAGSLSIKPEK